MNGDLTSAEAAFRKVLSEIIPLMAYDFYDLPPAIQDNSPAKKEIVFPVISEGMAQAVVFWFDLHLDEHIMVSSKQGGDLEHWGQALFCFPDQEQVKAGEQKAIQMIYSDHFIMFSLSD